MRKIPNFNFPAFEAATKHLRLLGHEVFSPAERDLQDGFDPTKDEPHGIDYYMAIDLPEVCKCEAVVLLPGWERSEGCSIEISVARAVRKKVIRIEDLCPEVAWTCANVVSKHLDVLNPVSNPVELKAPETQNYLQVSGVKEVRITDASGGQKCTKLERFDLIPMWALREIARVYGYGESKYPSDAKGPNWRKGYKWGLSFGAMLRHVSLFWLGQDIDPETGLHHMGHAAWHCLTLMTFWREKLGTDDRFDKTGGPEKS